MPYMLTSKDVDLPYLKPIIFIKKRMQKSKPGPLGHRGQMVQMDQVCFKEGLARINVETWNLGMAQNRWEAVWHLAQLVAVSKATERIKATWHTFLVGYRRVCFWWRCAHFL